MSALNERSISILIKLITLEKPLSFSDISDEFKVSERSIRNDIDSLISYLDKKNLKSSIDITKGSLNISNPKFKCELNKVLYNMPVSDVILSNNTRIICISMLIVTCTGYITIEEMCNYLFVSKTTIVDDLKKVKSEFKKFNLNLKSTVRGFKLVGGEFGKRIFIKSKLLSIKYDWILNDFGLELPITKWILSSIFSHTSNSECLLLINKTLSKIQNAMDHDFSDILINELRICLLLQINRIKGNHSVNFHKNQLDDFMLLKEYSVLKNELVSIFNSMKIELNESEIVFFIINLLGGSNISSMKENFENQYDIQIMTLDLLYKITDSLGIIFNSEFKIIINLINHMKSMIFRMKFELQLENPLLDDIKSNYKSIFEEVKKYIKPFETYSNAKITEDEVGFVTLYFAILFEQSTKETRFSSTPKVILVCNYGIGTANLLLSRLTFMYDINIVAVVSVSRFLDMKITNEIDLIISTIKLPSNSTGNIPNIVVDALLKQNNIEILDRLLKRKVNINNDKLIDVIKMSCHVVNEKQLRRDLNTFLTRGAVEAERKEIPMLRDVMKPELVALDYEATNWEDAVNKSGELLLQNGYIKESYIESMIETVKEVGPYIVISKGIALPHSRAISNVNKIGISMVRLLNPIEFGNKQNDPVKLVFAICSVDNNSHLKALQGLAELLMNPENVDYLNSEKDIYKVIEFIKERDAQNEN